MTDPRQTNRGKGFFAPQYSEEERRRLKGLEFFGFEFREKPTESDPKPENKLSFVPPAQENDPAFVMPAAGNVLRQSVDLRGDLFADERELVAKYRSAAEQPEVDRAIQDIVDEAIVHNDEDLPVTLNLQHVDVSVGVKERINKEFEVVCRLLEFRKYGADIFRRFYVDGKVAYHKVIDLTNPRLGILDLRPLSPFKTQKIREVEEKQDPRTGAAFVVSTSEYYVYSSDGFVSPPSRTASFGGNSGTRMVLKLPKDTVAYVTSGLVSTDRSIPLSYLHKALRLINQLRMMEDSLVVYRLARAPERRVFNIDVGDMTGPSAEAYVMRVMERYKSKIVYDPNTGEVRSDRKHAHLLEDYYLPRTANGRGTTVDSLAGGQNLGEIEDIFYFQKALYKALNVPVSRLDNETGFNLGRSTEITRDEVRFQKFINRLRMRFSELFKDLLRTQLLLKGILTEEEWNLIRENIIVDYARDSYFTELKENEILRERLEMLASVEPYIGKFFSNEYVRTRILRQTEDEVEEIKAQIRKEALTRDQLPNADEDGALGDGGGGTPGPDVGLPAGPDGAAEADLEDGDDFALGDPEGAATDLGADEQGFEDDAFDDTDFPELDDEEEQEPVER